MHISEIAHERTEDVSKVLSEGQELDVKLIGFDRGKMKLSVKALKTKADPKEESSEDEKEAVSLFLIRIIKYLTSQIFMLFFVHRICSSMLFMVL